MALTNKNWHLTYTLSVTLFILGDWTSKIFSLLTFNVSPLQRTHLYNHLKQSSYTVRQPLLGICCKHQYIPLLKELPDKYFFLESMFLIKLWELKKNHMGFYLEVSRVLYNLSVFRYQQSLNIGILVRRSFFRPKVKTRPNFGCRLLLVILIHTKTTNKTT